MFRFAIMKHTRVQARTEARTKRNRVACRVIVGHAKVCIERTCTRNTAFASGTHSAIQVKHVWQGAALGIASKYSRNGRHRHPLTRFSTNDEPCSHSSTSDFPERNKRMSLKSRATTLKSRGSKVGCF